MSPCYRNKRNEGKSAGATKANKWLICSDPRVGALHFSQIHSGNILAPPWSSLIAHPALLCLKEVNSRLIVFKLTAGWTRTPRGIVQTGECKFFQPVRPHHQHNSWWPLCHNTHSSQKGTYQGLENAAAD